MNVTFYELKSTSQANGAKKRPKKFSGIVAVSDDREVFVDSVLLGVSSMLALACCANDGSPLVHYKGRVFIPCKWAMKEFPSQSEAIERLSFLALEAADGKTVLFSRDLKPRVSSNKKKVGRK